MLSQVGIDEVIKFFSKLIVLYNGDIELIVVFSVYSTFKVFTLRVCTLTTA